MATDPIPVDEQACKNCRFCRVRKPQSGFGVCRRNPPTVNMVVRERRFNKDHFRGITTWDETIEPEGNWPTLSLNMWCGEWQGRV